MIIANRTWQVHIAVAVVLLLLVLMRMQDPNLRRPFEVDELLTLKYYTWVGIDSSGEHRPLNHIKDYYDLPLPSLMQLAIGSYCALGRWPEPNNHIVNSFLVNATLAVTGRDEWSARLPAVLGAVVFVGGLYYFCAVILRWKGAFLVVIWAWFTPYIIEFSQTSRGYTWMLAFQVLMLIAAYRLALRPCSIVLGSLTALFALLSLTNVVSMSVDWVLPYYAALLIARPTNSPLPPLIEPGQRAVWRRSVIVQSLAVASAGVCFFISHLPSLYSSARQYGLPFHSPEQFLEVGYSIFARLYPSLPDMAFAFFGLCGLVTICIRRQDRFLATIVPLLVVVNLLHFVAGRKFPFARTTGHFIPFILLGAAFLVDWVIRQEKSPGRRALLIGLLAALSVGLVMPSWNKSFTSKPLADRLELASQVTPAPDTSVHVPLLVGTDYLVPMYTPNTWRHLEVVPPGIHLAMLLFDQIHMQGLPFEASFVELKMLSGTTLPFQDGMAATQPSMIFWYPDFTQLGIDGADQRAFIQASGTRHFFQFARYQVKMDIYTHILCCVFDCQNLSESRRAIEAVSEALRRFGGRAVVFKPDKVDVLR